MLTSEGKFRQLVRGDRFAKRARKGGYKLGGLDAQVKPKWQFDASTTRHL